MRVMYERVAGIDVHKNMIEVGIRTPGHRAWTRTSEVLEYRTFFGVLLTMAADLRRRDSGWSEPVLAATGSASPPGGATRFCILSSTRSPRPARPARIRAATARS